MSILDRADRFERSAGGESGPRGCAPLAWSPKSRIARAQLDWYKPVSTPFTLSSTPQKVASINPNRGVISFAARIAQAVNNAGGVFLSINEDDAKNNRFTICLPAVYYASGSPAPVVFYVCKQYSYQQFGALVNAEFWAKAADAPASATLTVTEWNFFG